MIYWRKWWGPRDEVISRLGQKYNYNGDQYHYTLDSEDVEMIADVLESYDNVEKGRDDGSPVWDYVNDNISDQIQAYILVCKEIAKFMRTKKYYELKNDNKIEVYFYDSY